MKRFVGYIADKIIKATPRKKKVSPTIKSVKPTKDIAGSVEKVKRTEFSKRIDATNKSKGKIDQGKKMMREGQKELKRQVDTGKAFKFKYGTSREKTFPIEPGRNPKKEHGDLVEESKPQKKFKKGKELREKKMGGGMMGRRMGYSQGKLAVTPREKQLAAQYGDKKRITRGDVITAAKKKSGNKNV
jgi:hypothetical protein